MLDLSKIFALPDTLLKSKTTVPWMLAILELLLEIRATDMVKFIFYTFRPH